MDTNDFFFIYKFVSKNNKINVNFPQTCVISTFSYSFLFKTRGVK